MIRAYSKRSLTDASRHASRFSPVVAVGAGCCNSCAYAVSSSAASGRRANTTSSSSERKDGSISSYNIAVEGLTIPMSIPLRTA
ncbi:hypothetical protein Barb4_03644 [Bacteroidales bacterium Barb4]|nr:hypothetical protein Barb4_03644 [Bacteroidales bacterium Barb4]